MKKLSDKALEDFHKHIDSKNFDGFSLDAIQLDKRYHDFLNETVDCPHNDGWHYVNPTSWTDTEGYSKDNQACNICNVRLIYKGKIPRCLLYQEEE